jgi:hypothetical protein
MSQFLVQVVPLVLLSSFALGWLLSGLWVAKDAVARGKSGLLVSLLVLFAGWPLSLVLWLVMRPDNESPPFDLQQFRRQ